jgi:flavin-dependent dehydrogenase
VLEAEVAGPDDPPGLGLSRAALDDLIVREAVRRGAAWMPGTRVGAPIVEGGRVVGVSARSAGGGPIEVRARLVVAADGRHSALVRRTGRVRLRGLGRPAHFGLKRHLAVADPSADEPAGCVGLHLVPGGYVGACRVEGGATNVCGLLPEALSRAHRGDLDALAAAHFRLNPALGALWSAGRPLDGWKTVAGVRVASASPALGGVLYLGDGRGTVDPLGGQGMTMALVGAEVAEHFALMMMRRPDESLAMHRAYERAWHRRFDRRVRACMLIHEMLVRAWPIGLGARLGPIGRGGLRLARTLAVG